MLKQVKKTIHHYNMLDPGERVVVAVSGGPDSMALLYVLKDLNPELCLEICVAHLDHHLRRESHKDYLFVKNETGRLGFSFYGAVLDKNKLDNRTSLEDALRKYRYDFLLKASKVYKAQKIVLGHTQDDQAETVLMRILRGSGLYGLAAILPKRSLCGRTLVRPLIEVARVEVLKFLKKNRIAYRIDKTNFEDKFFRNKIRNRLLPVLEKEYNAGIKEILSNLALSVGADYHFLENLALMFFKKNARLKNNACSFKIGPLGGLDIALRRLVLREGLEKLRGDLRRISFRHWQEVEDLIFFRPDGAEVHLPSGLVVLKKGSALAFLKR